MALPGEPNVRPLAASDWDMFSSPGAWGWGQGHQAADFSTSRGMVWFPQLDTRREITSYTRTEILRKVRFLYANVGFCRRLINGIARMVAGTGLRPRPKTGDKNWNKLALDRIKTVYNSAPTYDLAAKFNGFQSQRARLRCRYKDGDVATIFTRGSDGRATTAIYEAHQIGNGRTIEGDEKTLFDGVRVDRNNRMLSLRLIGDDDTQADVPAASCALLADYERPGQNRCLSILGHAVNPLLDRTEINSYFKGSIKNAARIGYYIGTQPQSTPTTLSRPGGSASGKTVVTTTSGAKIALDKVFSPAGGEVQELDPGRELKILLDERPHPNTLGFLDELVRDISLGVDLSPEVLYNIVKLGGANIRYVMADAQSFIDAEQQVLVNSTLGPEYIWFLADEIGSGRLPKCPDPEWWKHDWITPARWTVDIGRDGKLHLEQLRSAALTFRRFFGWQGLDLDELDEWLDEYAYITKGAQDRGLDADKVIAAVYGRPSISLTGGDRGGTSDGGDPTDPPEERVVT
ncbi:MAG TPA: phage portal protein [Lacunisphaera sp.]|nr:phage portal protein [Lacunisphaera sp.]